MNIQAFKISQIVTKSIGELQSFFRQREDKRDLPCRVGCRLLSRILTF